MGRGLIGKMARFYGSNKRIIAAFVTGVAAAALVAGLGALAVVEFGLYDIRATQPHNKIVSWALHKSFKQSVRLSAGTASSPTPTQARLISGFKIYQADCLMCHGGPGVSRAPWVKGLEPTPPFLLDSGENWSSAQLHYIVTNGVKMTGMPAWGTVRSDQQIQDVVVFLKTLPGLSPARFARMQREFPPIEGK